MHKAAPAPPDTFARLAGFEHTVIVPDGAAPLILIFHFQSDWRPQYGQNVPVTRFAAPHAHCAAPVISSVFPQRQQKL